MSFDKASGVELEFPPTTLVPQITEKPCAELVPLNRSGQLFGALHRLARAHE